MKTFEDCLDFIENKLGCQLLSCQKEFLRQIYERKTYYWLPFRSGKQLTIEAAKLLVELMKENEL